MKRVLSAAPSQAADVDGTREPGIVSGQYSKISDDDPQLLRRAAADSRANDLKAGL
jgi:hypothetical protein